MNNFVLGQTTLASGAVVLRTNAGQFAAMAGGGLSAAENARELLNRELARYKVIVSDSLQEFLLGDTGRSCWRGRNNYPNAKDLALLYMAHNPGAVVCVLDSATKEILFTSNEGVI